MIFAVMMAAAAGLYILLALGSAAAVGRTPAAAPGPEDDLPRVSVLIAARDEAERLPRCLEAVAAQDYPRDLLECIVADDASADATPRVTMAFAETDARFLLVRLAEAEPGAVLRSKARALHRAIGAAAGDLLLVTDADCTPPPGWVRAMAAQFRDPNTGVICGVTVVPTRRMLDRIQSLDWMLLLSVAAAASAAGVPLTAMGNNMAFRREAYDEVGGYPAIEPSVTEDYALFRAVHERTRWRVRLLLDERLLNVTAPHATLRDVFNQRKRWARGGLKARPAAYALYLTVFLTHLLLVVGLLLAPALAAALLAGKVGSDLLVLVRAQRHLGRRGLLRAFPLFELYLFAYVLAMPAALLLRPSVRWKGRTY